MKTTTKKASDFQIGETVRYVPNHAHGDTKHEHCENGVVTSIRGDTVFCRFWRGGMLQETPQGCYPHNLI